MVYKPLEGIKVIELASVLAGPAVGMFFAELGAQVIKVENRSNGGDMTRQWKLSSEDSSSPISAYFSSVNYQKEYVDLDLTVDDDRERLQDLLKGADVLINNMKPSSALRFGVEGSQLRRQYPEMIIAELHGFANGNEQVAFDIVLQAETGWISMTGTEGHPAKLPVAIIDLMAAHQLKEAILLAMLQKSKDGKGALITTSLEESALSSLANQASNHLMTGYLPGRIGTLHPNIAPYGEIVTTQDGEQYILAIGTDQQFVRLCALLSIDLNSDPRFDGNKNRISHRAVLLELLNNAAGELNGDSFYLACLEQKVPVGKIRTLDEVLQSEAATKMTLDEIIEGRPSKRLSSIAFSIQR